MRTTRTTIAAALMLTALTFGAVRSAAQTVAVHNPSDSPAEGPLNAWPFGFFSDWRFTFIIDAAVLGSGGAARIDSLAFAPAVTDVFTATHFQVRMGHTSVAAFSAAGSTSFDRVLGSTPTIVYDGPIQWNCTAGRWSPIGLDRSFGWDGVSNVCCEVRYRNGSANIDVRVDPSIRRAFTNSSVTPNAYDAPQWISPIPGESRGPKHRVTLAKSDLLWIGSRLRLGGQAFVGLLDAPGGAAYQIAMSLSQGPIPVDRCSLGLGFDGLFLASLLLGPPVLNRYRGTVLPNGGALGWLNVPADSALAGVELYHAAVLFGGGRIACTNTVGSTLIP